MTDKEPVLLTVLIETTALRWHVAGIDLAGGPLPLLVSEPGNLRPYLGLPFDEQVSFLRHRLSGVLQRGCDRLWGRQKKPCQIVFVADGPFFAASAELTPRVAEHLVDWMTRPPVVFFTRAGESGTRPPPLDCVAGELAAPLRTALDAGLAALADVWDRPDAWELVPTKTAAQGG
jgi:hypothetical protein